MDDRDEAKGQANSSGVTQSAAGAIPDISAEASRTQARQERTPVAARMLAHLAEPKLALPIIVAIGTLLFIVNLGGYPLYTKGEPREAVTIFDIVHGGGVILPMRAGVEIPSKPLMMHWIAALVSDAAGGVNEWTVRMPSAVFAIIGMVLCYWYISRLFETRSAFLSALILGTSIQYLQAGTGARVDMTLTFFMEVAFFELIMLAEGLSNCTLPLYLALTFAILSKGPVGLLLPALVGAIWIILWQRVDLIHRLRLGRGALLIAIVAGGWYVAAAAVGGMNFIDKQILAENFYRLFQSVAFHQGHAHAFYYEDGALLVGFLPWSPVALLAALQYFRGARRIDGRFGYLLCWFLAVLIFYNLPQSKRGVYLLALYPALSAIVALLLCDAADQRDTIHGWVEGLSRVAGAFYVAAGIAGIIGLVFLFGRPEMVESILSYFGFRAPKLPAALASATAAHWIFSLMLPLATITIGFFLLRAQPLMEKMVGAISVGVVCIALAANLVVEPAIANALSPKEFAQRVTEIAGIRPFGYFGSLNYAFAFYNGRDVKLIPPGGLYRQDLIVSPEAEWKLLPASIRNGFEIILRSNPTDPDGAGSLLLLKRTSHPAREFSV
jgi:dolichyl-phosphate-mannose-protein mannosyltransferase